MTTKIQYIIILFLIGFIFTNQSHKNRSASIISFSPVSVTAGTSTVLEYEVTDNAGSWEDGFSYGYENKVVNSIAVKGKPGETKYRISGFIFTPVEALVILQTCSGAFMVIAEGELTVPFVYTRIATDKEDCFKISIFQDSLDTVEVQGGQFTVIEYK